MDNWIGRNIIYSHKGGEAYWGKGFSKAAQGFFNDQSKITSANYIDGSSKLGGDMSGSDRYSAGRTYAEGNLGSLTGGLEKVRHLKW